MCSTSIDMRCRVHVRVRSDGQTGSGKTYTMFGSETGDYKLRGIIPRSVEQLFQEIAENQEIEEVCIMHDGCLSAARLMFRHVLITR